MINRRILIGVGLVISAFFLFLAFRDLQPETFIASLSEINIPLTLLAVALYFGAVTVIAWRWQFLLRAVHYVALIPLTAIVAMGYMGNNVYPLRAGEALRIYLLKRNHKVPVLRTTTTIVVERVFDGLVMLAFILFALLFIEVQSDEIRFIVTLATLMFIPALTISLILAAQPNLLRRLVKWVSRILPGKLGEIVMGLSEDVLHGLEGLRTWRNLLGALFASFLTWSIEALVYWLVMAAFQLELGYPVALLVVATVNLAGLLPASPGQLGVYEFFVSAVLIAVGVAQDQALAYAIVVHIVIWLPVTLLGFILLARQGLGLDSITHAQELESQAAAS
jgi:glycosyltransferase 2 family protein